MCEASLNPRSGLPLPFGRGMTFVVLFTGNVIVPSRRQNRFRTSQLNDVITVEDNPVLGPSFDCGQWVINDQEPKILVLFIVFIFSCSPKINFWDVLGRT